MMDEETTTIAAGKSAGPILSALEKAHNDDGLRAWRDQCRVIEMVYGDHSATSAAPGLFYGEDYADGGGRLDLFWSSYEVMKPAVYAKAPVPAVAAKFSDGDPVIDTAAELLERVAITTLDQNNIDLVMKLVRDDLLFFGRGAMWLTYESDDGQRVCIEHVDRDDFRHECARYWDRVGWVAKRSWLSKKEMTKRFSEEVAEKANYSTVHRANDVATDAGSNTSAPQKCGVWEVWHRADNKVYWVTDGAQDILDESEPHLKLRDFFPCPRPAYGTTKLRSLTPVPDYERYVEHFKKISELTGRIYSLLEWVKMKGLVPGGADMADSIRAALADTSDATVIGVPGALLQQGAGDFVQWMPLQAIAEAITGLIGARQELINNFYELSGISDIMRGATDAEETLGAQQLKSQYGSVRVREKIDELQRIAADAVKVASEIIAEKFTQKSLLDMSGMKLMTRKEVEKRIKDIEKAAGEEMKGLADKVEQAKHQPEADPQQLEQQYQMAQRQIIEKYAPMLQEAEGKVAIESVVELLRDDRVRSFTFNIESDSTILTDEMQEKSSRAEFVTMIGGLLQQAAPLAAGNGEMAEFVGSVMKFSVAPYRAGRALEGAIDKLVKALPDMSAPGAVEGDEGLAEAQKALAAAEMEKAKAANMKVQADAAAKQAEMQRKMAEMQMKAQADQQKAAQERDRLQLQMADMGTKAQQAQTKLEAEIDKVRAQTLEILNNIGLANQRQAIDEFKSVADVEMRQSDQAMNAQSVQADMEFRAKDHERAERGDDRADRQQSLAEQAAMNERKDDA
jgi:hypothetical protein